MKEYSADIKLSETGKNKYQIEGELKVCYACKKVTNIIFLLKIIHLFLILTSVKKSDSLFFVIVIEILKNLLSFLNVQYGF